MDNIGPEIIVVNTNSLKAHPLNTKVYDKKNKSGLRDSIKEKGILVPIMITKDNVIVSGHSRWVIAKSLSISEVQAQVIQTTDELEIESAVIHSNRQRDKSKEEKAREVKELTRIESALASVREKAGKRLDPTSNLTQGEAAQIAAEHVGWSKNTGKKATAVIDAADALIAEGDIAGADELLNTLNNKSVDAAFNKIQPKEEPTATNDEPATEVTQAPRYKSRGKGIQFAEQAIGVLKRMPNDDGLFIEGHETVIRYCKDILRMKKNGEI